MSDEEEEFILDDEEETLDYTWSREHAVHDLVGLAVAMQQAVADYMLIVQMRLAADSNHHVIATEMHEKITHDIESLPVFKEPTEGTKDA